MKNFERTKLELQEEIRKVMSEIREQSKRLKNSKDYLKYLKECFEDENQVVKNDTNEFGDELVGSCASCGNDVSLTDINGNCKKCK